MPRCLFCDISDRRVALEGHPEHVILFESDNFYVKPALGHFVEGYSLVIAKDHVRTMAELNPEESNELSGVVKEIAKRLHLLYGARSCVFEHGAACPGNRAGSCIDHAHMHVLPVCCDITEQLSVLPNRRISDVHNLMEVVARSESYIYYESPAGSRTVYTCDRRVPSQFMRRLICERLSNERSWDWRVSPYPDEMDRFVRQWQIRFGGDRHIALDAPSAATK